MTARSETAGLAVAIVQARMGSSRLPGKTMERLGDCLVVDWVVDRLRSASTIAEVIVATTDVQADDVLVEHLESRDVRVVRGSSGDVLGRYAYALTHTDAQILVRVTADCPFIDPSIVDLGVSTLVDKAADYASTHLDGRFPRGLDAEALTRAALLRAHSEAVGAQEREHVTPFIYRNLEAFNCVPIVAPAWAARPDLRFTLDEESDLELLREVVAALGSDCLLGARTVISFLNDHPAIASLNSVVEHRNI